MNPEQWLSLKWNGGSTMSDRWLNQSKIIHRFSLGYRDFRKIVNYYGYRIYRKTTASGDECYRFVFSEKLWEHYN